MGKKKNKTPKLPSDQELLQELATLDEVEARITTDADHVAEGVPGWCELLLRMKRVDDGSLNPSWPVNVHVPLRRHDGELIIEVLHSVLHPKMDHSIFNMLWNELDQVVDRLVTKQSMRPKRDAGLAEGLTLALAILANPYAYDTDAIRAEAMARREAQ